VLRWLPLVLSVVVVQATPTIAAQRAATDAGLTSSAQQALTPASLALRQPVNPVEHTETLLIQHLPPPALHVQLRAKWMQESTSARPNNFVLISRHGDRFTAEMGTETFDVRLVVDTRDGHILSAAMHNPVALTTRTCTDRELTRCGPEASKTALREITWKLVP